MTYAIGDYLGYLLSLRHEKYYHPQVSKRITMKCKACGAKSEVNEHKLNTYIFKHPPAKSESKAEKKVGMQSSGELSYHFG